MRLATSHRQVSSDLRWKNVRSPHGHGAGAPTQAPKRKSRIPRAAHLGHPGPRYTDKDSKVAQHDGDKALISPRTSANYKFSAVGYPPEEPEPRLSSQSSVAWQWG